MNPQKIRSIAISLYQIGFRLLSRLPKRRLVVFESFNGRQYSDNPRAIYEYMTTHHGDVPMVWSVDRRFRDRFPEGLPTVTRFSPSWLLAMTTSSHWVTNSRFPAWFRKSPQTMYVQTWHGTPLKRLGVDIEEVHLPGTTTERYHQEFVDEASRWDVLVSPNPYTSSIFRRAFRYPNTLIESGYPRNDHLLAEGDRAVRDKWREHLDIPEGKRVILYAPTWRDDKARSQGNYAFDLEVDLAEMNRRLGDEVIILLRLHYLVAEHLDFSSYGGFVRDVSAFEDIRFLYQASDALITDYSSVFFDYSLLHRPVLFHLYDVDRYRDTLRGFYFDIEAEAPGPITHTTEELIGEVKRLLSTDFTPDPRIDGFRDTYGVWEDGEATKRVVEAVFRFGKGETP